MGLVSAQEAEPGVVLLFIPGQFDNAYQQHKNHALLRSCAAAGYGCVLANSGVRTITAINAFIRIPPGRLSTPGKAVLGSSFEYEEMVTWISQPGFHISASHIQVARVVLAGHSHGDQIAHYMRREAAADCVGAVALLSPSDYLANRARVVGGSLRRSPPDRAGAGSQGQPEALMPEWAFSAPMSAGTYAEAFGPGLTAADLRVSQSPGISALGMDAAGRSLPW